ncbi:NADPH-dependent conjugated polyketone reductase C1 [Acrasis kona]|uniref:NADPH-dependent conjugated polyketone reductase C1 n=1 Tax=Acrasis kona TaxID=1008807 RepID=A0AAW2YYE2_9EUKA
MIKTLSFIFILYACTALAKVVVPGVTFRNGVVAPKLAFGTGTSWHKKGNDTDISRELVESLKQAISLGYRHFDTADGYETEREVGVAIAESGIPREQFFITTKVYKYVRDPAAALARSLKNLNTTYLDMYLIHCPFFNKTTHGIDVKDVWLHMEKVYAQKVARVIGVSNFRFQDLNRMFEYASVFPMNNQFELHPYLQDLRLIEFSRRLGVIVEAYSPLTSLTHVKDGPVNGVVNKAAATHQVSAGEVLLAWNPAEIVVTTSHNKKHQEEMLNSVNLKLTQEEIMDIYQEGSKLTYRGFWKKEFEEWP